MKRLVGLFIVVAVYWFFFARTESVTLGPGIFAPDAPRQILLKAAPVMRHDDYILTPLAEFELTAKVLSRKNYWLGREAGISPVDLALGWGRMSDEQVISTLDIKQRNRWYYIRYEQSPIPANEMSLNSANMHIIPSDDAVAYQLKQVRQGDIVSIKGHLVRVDARDGWHWVSSLTRKDTGNGACELVLAKRIIITTNQNSL